VRHLDIDGVEQAGRGGRAKFYAREKEYGRRIRELVEAGRVTEVTGQGFNSARFESRAVAQRAKSGNCVDLVIAAQLIKRPAQRDAEVQSDFAAGSEHD
jgi:hypothetical protein